MKRTVLVVLMVLFLYPPAYCLSFDFVGVVTQSLVLGNTHELVDKWGLNNGDMFSASMEIHSPQNMWYDGLYDFTASFKLRFDCATLTSNTGLNGGVEADASHLYFFSREFPFVETYAANVNSFGFSIFAIDGSIDPSDVNSWETETYNTVIFTMRFFKDLGQEYNLSYRRMAANRQSPAPVPEPATILLVGVKIIGFIGKRKFSKNKYLEARNFNSISKKKTFPPPCRIHKNRWRGLWLMKRTRCPRHQTHYHPHQPRTDNRLHLLRLPP